MPPPIAASFTPRREFHRSPRHPAAFAILSFAGPASLRFSNFPAPLVHTLRQALEPVRGFREDISQNLFEISLSSKPWSQSRSVETELLVVQIFAFLLSHRYNPISAIDYGREADDKQCIVFSKQSESSKSVDGGSSSSLLPLVPFGISFPNTTTLRVINVPLHSTPAILQVIRGAWPRGVSGEKKVAESSYEFKLKGYSILREDTFPVDSLTHTLNLLSSFDALGFTLLSSVCVNGSHHRVKDLWIFGGPDEGSPPASMSAPRIPPLLSENDPVMAGAGSNGHLPLWEQFSQPNHGSAHQRAATAPEAERTHDDTSTRERVHSEALSTAATAGSGGAVVSKHSVLRKKPPVSDKQKITSSPIQHQADLPAEQDSIDMTGVGAPQHRVAGRVSPPEHYRDSTGAPNRVLYSTPRQPQFAQGQISDSSADRAPYAHQSHEEPTTSNHSTSVAAVLVAGTAVGSYNVAHDENFSRDHREPSLADGSDPHEIPQDALEVSETDPRVAVRPGPNVVQGESAESDPQMSEHLLGSGVFRNTAYTGSVSQTSSESVPKLPSSAEDVDETSESPETPKVATAPLPIAESHPPGLPHMTRFPTQLTTPLIPGGWAPTPAQEYPPSTQLQDGLQAEIIPSTHTVFTGKAGTVYTDKARKSEFGQIGNTTLVSENDSSQPTDTPEQLLAREEAKLPPGENNGHGYGSVKGEDAPNPPPDSPSERTGKRVASFELVSGSRTSLPEPSTSISKNGESHPPSVFKRILNRTRRLSSR